MSSGVAIGPTNAHRHYHAISVTLSVPLVAVTRPSVAARITAKLCPSGFLFADKPNSIDAGIYGFLANSYFYDIDTPLERFIVSHADLARYCNLLHATVTG